MTKKVKTQANRTVEFRIAANYSSHVLCPDNALEISFYKRDPMDDVRFRTLDGKLCSVRFISSHDNEDGQSEDVLDLICQKRWGVPFQSVRSMWFGRMGDVSNWWHLIELQETNL